MATKTLTSHDPRGWNYQDGVSLDLCGDISIEIQDPLFKVASMRQTLETKFNGPWSQIYSLMYTHYKVLRLHFWGTTYTKHYKILDVLQPKHSILVMIWVQIELTASASQHHWLLVHNGDWDVIVFWSIILTSQCNHLYCLLYPLRLRITVNLKISLHECSPRPTNEICTKRDQWLSTFSHRRFRMKVFAHIQANKAASRFLRKRNERTDFACAATPHR